MTRVTNGLSKKIENHDHAVALHFYYYHYARKHMMLKATPAVAAGLANKAYELVKLIEDRESKLGGRITDYLPAAKQPDSE